MIKIKNLISKKLLKEGIIDGLKASFIIDSGINKNTVNGYKKSMSLPRYSVWGFKENNNKLPKLMENGYNISDLLKKYNLTENDVFQVEDDIESTIKKIVENKFSGSSKKNIKIIK